jgi:hypothetical protein
VLVVLDYNIKVYEDLKLNSNYIITKKNSISNQVAVIKVIVEIRVLDVYFFLTIFLVFFMMIVVESLKRR